jgi:hypothetical protein
MFVDIASCEVENCICTATSSALEALERQLSTASLQPCDNNGNTFHLLKATSRPFVDRFSRSECVQTPIHLLPCAFPDVYSMTLSLYFEPTVLGGTIVLISGVCTAIFSAEEQLLALRPDFHEEDFVTRMVSSGYIDHVR